MPNLDDAAAPPPRRSALLLAAEYPPFVGGIATYSRAIAQAVARIGWDVQVVTSTPGGDVSSTPGLRVVRTPAILNRKYLKIVPLLAAALASCLRRRPDVLMLMKCNHEGVVGLVIRSLFRVRYIVVVYGTELLELGSNRAFGPVLRWLLARAAAVVAISTYTADLVSSVGASTSSMHIIPPVVEIPRTMEPQRDAKEALRIAGRHALVTVARLVPRKGHDRVLEALSQVVGEFPDLVYLIAGDGPHRAELERLVASHGLEKHVRILGAISDQTLERVYAACDVFVMASRQEGLTVEGFGIAFVEAAIRGKPAVAGRCGGVTDAVADGVTGLIVDPTDSREIAAALRRLLRDAEGTRAMGVRARERALEQFTAARQERQFTELLAQLTSGA